jgi:hypothetical protein
MVQKWGGLISIAEALKTFSGFQVKRGSVGFDITPAAESDCESKKGGLRKAARSLASVFKVPVNQVIKYGLHGSDF